ncbi:MAG: hypothetical protein BIFFINMI_02519 [Phycisphaerae bacterium]|nr:hypothetical protein [Phycisphaerae bacterium]
MFRKGLTRLVLLGMLSSGFITWRHGTAVAGEVHPQPATPVHVAPPPAGGQSQLSLFTHP